MAKPPKKSKSEKPEDVETVPDAWERFERAVDAAIKSGPKHREAPKPKRKQPRPKRERDKSVAPKGKKAKSTSGR